MKSSVIVTVQWASTSEKVKCVGHVACMKEQELRQPFSRKNTTDETILIDLDADSKVKTVINFI
jgi:hypothetical protein